MSFIKDSVIKQIAQELLATLEVQPLSYGQKLSAVREIARDDFGLSLNVVQARYAVKLADLDWDCIKQSSKGEVRQSLMGLKRSSLDAFI